eukprot:TRINITY_DN21479_c0_g1_i1.p1 TRINITY_DN21479_c0_g1~~TRINITY_DN21479_c0_g1_i1.p1  ORF type:complete len:164 (+),score=27.68 TRINITY_DN21479_c0_g1_i1:106-597(+)
MVKSVPRPGSLVVARKGQEGVETLPFGVFVWAGGIGARPFTNRCASQLGLEAGQNSKRGLVVDDHFRVLGAKDVFALGDCAVSGCPPTAQAAGQQGKWLGRRLRDGDLEDAAPFAFLDKGGMALSLIHISEPTRLLSISYAVFCLKKKKPKYTYTPTITTPVH